MTTPIDNPNAKVEVRRYSGSAACDVVVRKRGREMVTEGRWSSATSGGLLFGRHSNCFKSISRTRFSTFLVD